MRGVPTTPFALGVPLPVGRCVTFPVLAPMTPNWPGRGAEVRPAATPSAPTTVPRGIRGAGEPAGERCGVPPTMPSARPVRAPLDGVWPVRAADCWPMAPCRPAGVWPGVPMTPARPVAVLAPMEPEGRPTGPWFPVAGRVPPGAAPCRPVAPARPAAGALPPDAPGRPTACAAGPVPVLATPEVPVARGTVFFAAPKLGANGATGLGGVPGLLTDGGGEALGAAAEGAGGAATLSISIEVFRPGTEGDGPRASFPELSETPAVSALSRLAG